MQFKQTFVQRDVEAYERELARFEASSLGYSAVSAGNGLVAAVRAGWFVGVSALEIADEDAGDGWVVRSGRDVQRLYHGFVHVSRDLILNVTDVVYDDALPSPALRLGWKADQCGWDGWLDWEPNVFASARVCLNTYRAVKGFADAGKRGKSQEWEEANEKAADWVMEVIKWRRERGG